MIDGDPRSELVYEVLYCFGEIDLYVVFEDVGLGKILLEAVGCGRPVEMANWMLKSACFMSNMFF